MTNEIIISGQKYIQPDCCSFGDYGGSGSIGLANIRYILAEAKAEFDLDYARVGKDAPDTTHNVFGSDLTRAADSESRTYDSDETIALREACASEFPPLVLHVTYDYSGETVYLLESWEHGAEIIAALSDYPSLDDEAVSEIESQWETEAWESWLRHDLERAAWPENHEPDDDTEAKAYDTLPDDDKFAAYRGAMEAENEYPTAEHSSIYVNIDKIAATYRTAIMAILNRDQLTLPLSEESAC